MLSPDVNALPVCCAKCGGRVKIVCDAHGVDCVLDLRATPPATIVAAHATSKPEHTVPRAGHGERRTQVLALTATGTLTAKRLVDELGITMQNACVQLTELTKRGELMRIAPGEYIKTTGVLDARA